MKTMNLVMLTLDAVAGLVAMFVTSVGLFLIEPGITGGHGDVIAVAAGAIVIGLGGGVLALRDWDRRSRRLDVPGRG